MAGTEKTGIRKLPPAGEEIGVKKPRSSSADREHGEAALPQLALPLAPSITLTARPLWACVPPPGETLPSALIVSMRSRYVPGPRAPIGPLPAAYEMMADSASYPGVQMTVGKQDVLGT